VSARGARNHGGDLDTDIQAVSSRILLEAQRANARSLCIVGAHRGAGVTTLCGLLAREVAASGREVVVVDGNPADAGLHSRFEIAASPGVADVLSGRHALADAQRIVAPRLFVLPAGHQVPETAPVSARAWSGLIAQAVAQGRMVILDGGCAESASLSEVGTASDGIVIVAEAGRSRWEQLGALADRAAALGIPVLGAILNRRTFPIPEAIYRWI
jgi:receptor protein-tyrosine kinase